MSRLTLTYLTCDHDGCDTQWPEQPAARHPLAVCAVCGGPTPGALADCPNPTCVAETIRIEMVHVRREDQ